MIGLVRLSRSFVSHLNLNAMLLIFGLTFYIFQISCDQCNACFFILKNILLTISDLEDYVIEIISFLLTY